MCFYSFRTPDLSHSLRRILDVIACFFARFGMLADSSAERLTGLSEAKIINILSLKPYLIFILCLMIFRSNDWREMLSSSAAFVLL